MGRITPLQLYMLFSQFLFSTIIGFYVHSLVGQAGYMVWISILIGSISGLFLSYLAYRLSLRRPARSIGQYGHEIMGKWLHYPLITLVIISNVFIASLVLHQLVAFIGNNYLQETPEWAIAAVFGLCIAQAVRSGPTTIFHIAPGLFLFSLIAALVFPLLAVREVNIDMAVAFVTHFHLKGTWNGILMITALFAEMGSIAYFFSNLGQPYKLMKSLGWASVTAVIIALIAISMTILLVGPELTAQLNSPEFDLIRYIQAGVSLESLIPLLLVFWLFSMFLTISLFLLVAVMAVTHTLGLKDHKPFSYLMGMTMVYLSLYLFKSAAMMKQITDYSVTTIILLTCMVPALYWLVDLLRSLSKKDGPKAPTSVKGS